MTISFLLTMDEALMDSSHNFAKAKRLWIFDQDFRKAKKNIVHGLRWLLFTLQILNDGNISDFSAGNEYWFTVPIFFVLFFFAFIANVSVDELFAGQLGLL